MPSFHLGTHLDFVLCIRKNTVEDNPKAIEDDLVISAREQPRDQSDQLLKGSFVCKAVSSGGTRSTGLCFLSRQRITRGASGWENLRIGAWTFTSGTGQPLHRSRKTHAFVLRCKHAHSKHLDPSLPKQSGQNCFPSDMFLTDLVDLSVSYQPHHTDLFEQEGFRCR